MNATAQTVDRLRAELQVEEEWSVPLEGGFRWWPGRQAQTIAPGGASGADAGAVAVRTELLRGVDLWPVSLTSLNTYVLQLASLGGAVYDEERRSLSLCSLVRVGAGEADALLPLLRLAALLQVGEARLVAAQLAPAIGAEIAATGHPERGERAEAHRLARTMDDLAAEKYHPASAWTEDEVREVVDHGLDESLALSGTREGAGLTAEFRCGRSVSVCYVRADQPHPRYGPGLFVLQTLPLAPPDEAGGAELALFFNGRDLASGPLGALGLGSYAYREGGLYFTTFFPNAAHRPGLLADVYTSCAQRAAGVGEVLREAG